MYNRITVAMITTIEKPSEKSVRYLGALYFRSVHPPHRTAKAVKTMEVADVRIIIIAEAIMPIRKFG